MAIELFVDDIEAVDESLRDSYTKGDDGRYVLKGVAETLSGYVKVDDIEKHEKTQGLVSALDKEREARREMERKARELEERSQGLTEEEKKELAALRNAKEEAEEARRRKEGEFDKWREDIAQKHTEETKGFVEKIKSLEAMLTEDRVSREIAEAVNEFGGRAAILEPLIRRHVEAGIEEDRVNVSVKDGDGTRMLDDSGNPLSIKGFVERMAGDKEFGDLFASKMKSGGGSTSDENAEQKQRQASAGDDGQRSARLQELESKDRTALTPHERLELSRLRGTAPTTEQMQEARARQAGLLTQQ